MSLPDLSQIRGMSDPMFFTFNIEKKSKILICHGLVFTSLVLPEDADIKLVTLDDDPRMVHLVKYVRENFLKGK